MIKSKEKIIEMAKNQVPKGMVLVRVGNLDQCWRGHKNNAFYNENKRLCVWRVDGSEFVDGDPGGFTKVPEIFTNENDEYWYAVADYIADNHIQENLNFEF